MFLKRLYLYTIYILRSIYLYDLWPTACDSRKFDEFCAGVFLTSNIPTLYPASTWTFPGFIYAFNKVPLGWLVYKPIRDTETEINSQRKYFIFFRIWPAFCSDVTTLFELTHTATTTSSATSAATDTSHHSANCTYNMKTVVGELIY